MASLGWRHKWWIETQVASRGDADGCPPPSPSPPLEIEGSLRSAHSLSITRKEDAAPE
jgi:hypothetical protein